VTDSNDKPILDEQTFARLLEAAHVLQEHNRKLRDLEAIMESERRREIESENETPLQKPTPKAEESGAPSSDYMLTLAEIVEAQRQIQMRHLELNETMSVVAERVMHITGAHGAGIGLLEGKTVRYRAGMGAPALPNGSEVPLKQAVCAACVRTGQVIRSEDVNTEVLFDPEPCRQRGIFSLIAVPIYQDGGIVGGLELYFDKIHGYAEQDIHTCQLMAGLLTEALGREAELALKKSMAAERTSMLAAIEKLRPSLSTAAAAAKDQPVAISQTIGKSPEEKFPCVTCDNELTAEELFCGRCGSPRSARIAPPNGNGQGGFSGELQPAFEGSHLETGRLGHEQVLEAEQAALVPTRAFAASNAAHAVASSAPPSQGEESQATGEELDQQSIDEQSIDHQELDQPSDAENDEAGETALVKPEHEEVVWSSAARARDFLESLTVGRTPGAFARFWQSRRGDFYLGLAVILVIVVIRWGILSNQPTVATAGKSAPAASHHKVDPEANLSTFDKLLIDLGLAEAPDEPTEYRGNPETPVWLDLQTALYYCPGSDLYEKTPKGRIASQRDAQLDQFEPAYRKACN
jgi:putative methionine-R-sulfoxide reductase with GAF domain